MNTMTHSDCIAYLRTLPDASVDSCVTDPPYELGFMGKKWDSSGIAYSVELWREVLRVLKPGAHLLAAGSSRTHHRMFCAIEDAGFEVRDTLTHLFGQGFPKSLSVEKQLRNTFPPGTQCSCAQHSTGTDEDSQSGCPADSRSGDESLPSDAGVGQGAAPSQAGARARSRAGRPVDARGEAQASIFPDEASALPSSDYLPDRALLPSGDSQGRDSIPSGTSSSTSYPDGTADNRTEPDKSGSDNSVCDSVSSSLRYPHIPRCEKCGKVNLSQWNGFGTALKPAAEYWCLARKPLEGTVSQNVLKHGTGGINVDGSRIDSGGTHGSASSAGLGSGKPASGVPFVGGVISAPHPKGRWPSNCLLSHAEGCVCTGTKRVKGTSAIPRDPDKAENAIYGKFDKFTDDGSTRYADADGLETVETWQCVEGCPVRLLDEQSGESKSTTGVRDPNGTMGYHGGASGLPGIVSGHSDTGGASRFFYTAKSSKSDREHFNTHATVKPLALMRYLVRLVTPPGGVVLDMFAGSGTTLVAARQEGFRFLGCDADEGHVRIAQDRLALELPFET